MKTKSQIQTEIAKLQKQLEIIEETEKEQDYQKVTYKGKEFRIYKWAGRLGDFKLPNGFNFCPAIDFIKLINEDKIVLDKYPVYYYVRSLFKKCKDDWSAVYDSGGRLRFGGGWDDHDGGHAFGVNWSDKYGRMVVVK
jgi:hypothetical protein